MWRLKRRLFLLCLSHLRDAEKWILFVKFGILQLRRRALSGFFEKIFGFSAVGDSRASSGLSDNVL